jgi:hypothetical protein
MIKDGATYADQLIPSQGIGEDVAPRRVRAAGAGRARWTMRWKPVINAFAITFGDRWPDAETY